VKRWLIGAVGACALAVLPRPAQAFCRGMSCDPANAAQHCSTDARTQCVLSGQPLYWSSSCVTFSVQKDGAPQAGISYSEARDSVERALTAWTSADCSGQQPSLSFALSDPVSCDQSEYNRDNRNANIVMFREGEWPYEGGEDALGVTRVRFDIDQHEGELRDADIELNAVTEPLSVGKPKANEVDLDSLLTHEVGHALGLGHSVDLGATMIAGYVKGTTGLRSLGTDDIDGICSVYPPGRDASSSSCEPRHGFSELCGAEQPDEPADTGDGGGASPSESKGCNIAAVGSDLPATGGGLAPLALGLAWILGRVRGRERAAR
jgi:hypothetical protein